MLQFKKISTLFETTYGILALLSTAIVCFCASRVLVQHYLNGRRIVLGIGSHPVGFLDGMLTFLWFFLICSTYDRYEDTWRDKLLYGAKLLVCYGLCFMVTDGVVPALEGKSSAMLTGSIAQDTLKEFILIVIPFLLFWFILSPHTTTVFEWSASGGETLERGASTIAYETLREEGGQSFPGDQREARETTAPAKRAPKNVRETVAPKRIRIMDTPQGFAPEKIRSAWIGVEFTLEPEYERPERLGGITVYQVDATVALQTLRARAPRAAHWWTENAPDLFEPGGLLGFPVEACAVILEGEVRAVVTDTVNPTSAKESPEGASTASAPNASSENELPDMRRYAEKNSSDRRA